MCKMEKQAVQEPMERVPLRSFEQMPRWGREMERMFGPLFKQDLRLRPANSWGGKTVQSGDLMLNLFDGDEEVVVKAEVPGLTRNEIDIQMMDNVLTIKAEKKNEEKTLEGDDASARVCGGFICSLPLPLNVDRQKVRTTVANGTLEIRVGKK